MRVDRITTLGYVLLGLLAEKDRSGYDLARALKTPVSYFWYAKHSQIYPELQRLKAQGLVTYRVVHQAGRPDKKIYTITPQGLEAVQLWTTSPFTPEPPRNELLLRAYFLWLADPKEAVELFREHEQLHLARLAEYEQTLASYEQVPVGELNRLDSPLLSNYLTLLKGIGYEREFASWCRLVVEKIEVIHSAK